MAGATVEPCQCGKGDCAVPDDAIAIERGYVFRADLDTLVDRWGSLEGLGSIQAITSETMDILETHAAVNENADDGGGGVAAQPAPLPAIIRQQNRAVVVQCSPCGHVFLKRA